MTHNVRTIVVTGFSIATEGNVTGAAVNVATVERETCMLVESQIITS